LEADAERYLDRVKHRLAHPDDRQHEVAAWFVRFRQRGRHAITKDEVKEQVKDWLAAGVAASTIRHRLTALSSLYVELDGDEAFNPVRGVRRPKEPEPQPDFRPPEVIVRVLDELAWRAARNNRGWKTLARALVLTYTGVRPSQMMRLDVSTHVAPYFEQDAPLVYIPAGKGGRAHWKPLTPGGVAAFRLFVNSGAQGKFSTSRFYKSWMLACDDAKITRFNPYKLRHSYATLLRRSGADVADIEELLGHKSPKTTQRYAMVIPEKLVAATQRLQKAWTRSSGQTVWTTPETTESKTTSRK
jgi:integrase